MGKRASIDTDGLAAYRKRKKLTHDAPSGEDVSSSAHLRSLLVFDQDLRRARHGLQSLKKLLDEIPSDHSDRAAKQIILQEYLQAVRPPDDGETAVFLYDIMQSWSLAAQTNDEGVSSSVAVVLALLLQIISETLDLIPHGIGICQTLLQERQLAIICKNLCSEKNKAFIISPTLRLLREIVCLDGGVFAKKVFNARSETFACLARNLEIIQTYETFADIKRTSVRTNAVKFLLACLKYLPWERRKELLTSQRELLSHLCFIIKDDPSYIVLEILNTLHIYVLKGHGLSSSQHRLQVFNLKTLLRLLALYGYQDHTDGAKNDAADVEKVKEQAHVLLLTICTSPTAGILYPDKGLYPRDDDNEHLNLLSKSVIRDADVDPWEARLHDDAPIHNFLLSELAGKLRPWSNLKHGELLVAIFKAAPELVADYFQKNKSFTFEPKLSMTWIGYATFLFNTITIPLPPSFGNSRFYAQIPPPTMVLRDNILPPIVNRKILTRCLSLDSPLISFFAARLLVAALEKLSEALRMHDSGSCRKNDPLWSQAARRLFDSFSQQVPDMKGIVRCYKQLHAEHALQRFLISRLLRLYHEIIPRVALAANFDVSPLLLAAFKRLRSVQREPAVETLSVLELEDLVRIASYSPGMRWFSKLDDVVWGFSLSAFTSLLHRLCHEDRKGYNKQLLDILTGVASENQIVTKDTGLRPLLRSLQGYATCANEGELKAIWLFLDNSINRCATNPLRYLDLSISLAPDGDHMSPTQSMSLLTMTFLEQLPFSIETATETTLKSLTRFLSLYLNASFLEGDSSMLQAARGRIHEQLISKRVELSALGDSKDVALLESIASCESISNSNEGAASDDTGILNASQVQDTLHVPFINDDEDTSILARFSVKSVEDLFEDGSASRLIGLLASQHINIRKEATMALAKVAAQIKASTDPDKTQLWLLICELAESSKAQVDAGPVPSAFIAFATHSLDILRAPLHPLYTKVNLYLTRSPVWAVEKVPLVHDILHSEPSEDDRYYTEVAWLLDYLLDCLRTPFDLGILHKKKWFEKIFTLGNNPYLKYGLSVRLFRIIFRATCIESGSTTLITRFGILSWLDTRRRLYASREESALVDGLMVRLWRTCDQDRVETWGKSGMRVFLQSVLPGHQLTEVADATATSLSGHALAVRA